MRNLANGRTCYANHKWPYCSACTVCYFLQSWLHAWKAWSIPDIRCLIVNVPFDISPVYPQLRHDDFIQSPSLLLCPLPPAMRLTRHFDLQFLKSLRYLPCPKQYKKIFSIYKYFITSVFQKQLCFVLSVRVVKSLLYRKTILLQQICKLIHVFSS